MLKLICLLFISAWAIHLLGSQSDRNSAGVTGKVSILTQYAQALKHARLVFQRSDGYTLDVKTNDTGEYTARMPAGTYTVTAESKGTCPVHRPPFQLTSATTVHLNFTLVICGFVDPIEIDPSGNRPMCREEIVKAYTDVSSEVLISFGSRQVGDSWVRYDSLPVASHPETRLPVTLSFGTSTVTAQAAIWDKEKMILRAEGDVSIEDGVKTPYRSTCAAVDLRASDLRVEPCTLR